MKMKCCQGCGGKYEEDNEIGKKPGLDVMVQVSGGGSISNVLGLHADLKDIPLSFAALARSETSFFPPNTLAPNVYQRWCTSIFFDNTEGHWSAAEIISAPQHPLLWLFSEHMLMYGVTLPTSF